MKVPFWHLTRFPTTTFLASSLRLGFKTKGNDGFVSMHCLQLQLVIGLLASLVRWIGFVLFSDYLREAESIAGALFPLLLPREVAEFSWRDEGRDHRVC